MRSRDRKSEQRPNAAAPAAGLNARGRPATDRGVQRRAGGGARERAASDSAGACAAGAETGAAVENTPTISGVLPSPMGRSRPTRATQSRHSAGDRPASPSWRGASAARGAAAAPAWPTRCVSAPSWTRRSATASRERSTKARRRRPSTARASAGWQTGGSGVAVEVMGAILGSAPAFLQLCCMDRGGAAGRLTAASPWRIAPWPPVAPSRETARCRRNGGHRANPL